MVCDTSDTIAAVATATGGACRGIVRMAGEESLPILAQVFLPRDPHVELDGLRGATRVAGTIDLGEPLGIVPAEVLVWPGRRSYTRQPAAEIHTIGSPPLMEATLACLGRAGARVARPGEFTLRSFLAGRIDLTQAEAVLGVIDARDQRELQVALAQLAGGLATPLGRLRDQLLELLAYLEAGLDFVEEDIEFLARDELNRQLDQAAAQIEALARQMQRRGLAGDRPRVVFRGEPNAGKSSLFNALCGSAAALVSQTPGTTRDYVSTAICCGGIEFDLVDTAGMEGDIADGSIAAAAQQMAAVQVEQASLTVLCVDASRPPTSWERLQLAAGEKNPRWLAVSTKCDAAVDGVQPAAGILCTSSRSGQGVAELKVAIAKRLAGQSPDSAVVPGTAARCQESLQLAARALHQARLAAEVGEEYAAAEIRSALDHLGQVVGAVYTDDVLDRIFTRFCIGK